MRVFLTSHGSIGDIYPILAYGKALAQAGHQVTFGSAPLYRQEIVRAGLQYIHLPPDWEQERFTEFMRELDRARHPILQLREIYRGALPFLSELIDQIAAALEDHDVLVGSYLFPHYKVIAARQNKPFVSFAFCHNTIPSPDYPPELVPGLRGMPRAVRTCWNLFFWKLADIVVDKTINRVIGKVLAQKKLPPAKNFLLKPADLVLVEVSKALMADRGKIDTRFQFTGFLRWQAEKSEEQEARIVAFCQGSRVPVLTFGSVAFDDTPAIMNRFEKNWPRGKKIIVQTGWSGLSVEVERPEILFVGKLSHDQLFQQASCVIHHGGAGTTASVLSAGRPHIIIPHIADQNFWGAEMTRLGVGIVLNKKQWPEQLHDRVGRIEQTQAFYSRALEVQQVLEAEDGAANAVKALERFVAQSQDPAGKREPPLARAK